MNGDQYEFSSWSDGGAQVHSVRTPNVDTTYQANFSLVAVPPAPWVSADIGVRTIAGSSIYAGDTFTVSGGGSDIWEDTDEFRYVYQPLVGDGEIVARVTDQEGVDPWSKSGVMIKETATPGATYAAIAVSPANGMHFQYDFHGDPGEHPYAFPNAWMKLTRSGDVISAYRSADGVSWTSMGTTTLAMAGTVTVGLFVSSHLDSQLCTTVFDSVSVTQAEPPPGELPAPWQRVDVGAAAPTGTAGYQASSSTFTVEGGGTDIWAETDQSSYVWRPLTGDGSIAARVTSQEDTDGWAKAGVMMKESTTAGSAYAAMMVTPANGSFFQANFTMSAGGAAYSFPDAWVKLTRTGNTVTGYRSVNGTDWTIVGETTVDMTADVTIGLFVNAHNGGTALGTATFDQVTVTGGTGPALPAPWVSGDIGAPPLAGSASETGGTFTVSGAGSDIWGGEDQFHFVHQPLAGDGTIVARVVSQDDTSEWAKSGLMVKASATAGATYAAVMVTPDHGARLQANFVNDTGGAVVAPPNAWLKLTRVGNTFTAYTSVDGSAWILLGSQTVTMPRPPRSGSS